MTSSIRNRKPHKQQIKRRTPRKSIFPKRRKPKALVIDVGRLTLWASRDVLDAVRHAAIDYRVSEGAMFEAAARSLLDLPPKRLAKLLARYGASRRRARSNAV